MFCPCPLCLDEKATPLKPAKDQIQYFHCERCDLRFLDPSRRLSAADEEARYREHNNDVKDIRYQQFVTPLIGAVTPFINQKSHGLDFGAGTGPVLAELMREDGHEVSLYDPFFWPNTVALDKKYDFVVSSEVVEHFYNPHHEFQIIRNLLLPKGVFGLMTALYTPEIDFETWYYRKD